MRWRLLADPSFGAAVALLAVNDHLLKGRWPGVVTGKLSDLAGVFVMAVLLGVLGGRPRLAVVATGLGFTAIKTFAPAAGLAAPLLGGVTGQDPTDLVALVVLVPAHRFLARRLSPVAEPGLAAQVLALGSTAVAVLAVSATSCLEPPSVDAFVADAGGVSARIRDDDAAPERTRWAHSADGGATWRAASAPPIVPVAVADEACSPGLGCFRLRGRSVEHAPPDAAPRTAFRFSDEQRERMQRRTAGSCGAGIDDGFRSVAVVARPDGDHVVVAMGTQGALHRSAEGRWSRVAVLDLEPVPLHGPSWLWHLSLAPLVLVPLSVGVLLVGLWRRTGRRSAVGCLVTLVGAVVLLVVVGVLAFGALDYTIQGPLIAALSVGVLVVGMVVAWRRPPPPTWSEPQR